MRAYLDTTRTHTYTLLFALPLLVLYELGAAAIARTSDTPLRNGADVLLRALLSAGGLQGTVAFTAALAVAAAVLVALERRKKRVPLRGAWFAGMLAESVAYALVFGAVVGTATQWVLRGAGMRLAAGSGGLDSMGKGEGIVLSLGAGIYEELVFRVVLAGGAFALLKAMGMKRGTAGLVAALVAALLFSAFHYVGPYAYPWELSTFTFRFLAGLALNALFLLRGFGIAAWTHALYDVFLVVAGVG